MSSSAQDWTEIRNKTARLKTEIAKAIVGQEEVVEQMLASLFCRGHCLIIGVPGLGKTMLVRTLGRALGLNFNRIQFTPDLMPTDILGSEILQAGDGGVRRFEFTQGPIFTNLLLADEINRTPPKTQAALLEAMQERTVTVSGETYHLEEPFTVYATQNPIEHEGTYPLPEAQLDRFFFTLKIDYPKFDEEREIVRQTIGTTGAEPEAVMSREEVLQVQSAIREVPVPDHVLDTVLRLVASTRPGTEGGSDLAGDYIGWGAGPRASQYLTQASQAFAILRGHNSASVEDVYDAALPILRHRVIPNYHATGEGLTADDIVKKLIEQSKGHGVKAV